MKIIRAKVLGFCMGVRRAEEIALSEAARPGKKRVFTFGSLVHNPRVLANLKKRGIETLNELPADFNFKDSTVIIRAHGINPDKEDYLRKMCAAIIDATCPKVKQSQNKAKELSKSGYCIFLAGEARHAEIEGILGYVNEAPFYAVVENAEEAGSAAEQFCKTNLHSEGKIVKTALLGQTTISQDEYIKIGDELKKYFPDLEIHNTICSATEDRQRALRELLVKTDAVIIAGGRESANTKRLFAIARESGKPCVLAESAEEIPPEFLNYGTVGISAGASTPDCVIDEIAKKLGTSNHTKSTN